MDNRIVCPDCGLSGYLTLFGGYDWEPFHFNYIHTGFTVSDAALNVNFEIDGVAGYSVDQKMGLDHVDIVGISIADVFSVDVTASLGAEVTFALNGGGITINNLGVEWTATQDLRFDMCWEGCTTSFSGWDQNLVPQVLTPELNMIPSDFSFRGSIGPALGVSASVGRKWSRCMISRGFHELTCLLQLALSTSSVDLLKLAFKHHTLSSMFHVRSSDGHDTIVLLFC